jgi:hypothetical protein
MSYWISLCVTLMIAFLGAAGLAFLVVFLTNKIRTLFKKIELGFQAHQFLLQQQQQQAPRIPAPPPSGRVIPFAKPPVPEKDA